MEIDSDFVYREQLTSHRNMVLSHYAPKGGVAVGMFGEIARENVVHSIVVEIKKELDENKEKPEVCEALKKIGRFALNQLDFLHDWAREDQQLFEVPESTSEQSR